MMVDGKRMLENASYGVYGHSAVEICSWTKSALRGKGVCYKNKFYGIETHRCMEFSPAALFCHNRCIYCWRMCEFFEKPEMGSDIDEPQEIIKNLMEKRRQLLSGFGGNGHVDKKIFRESLKPSHFAISLIGEPTLYPMLPEMIRYLKSLSDTKSVFLVTNGEEPEMVKRLEQEDSLPTQLYVSVNAGRKETFKRISASTIKGSWERLLKTLDIISKIGTRTVMRITLIRGLNDSEEEREALAKMVERGNPHFVEIKSYIHIGYSRKRLSGKNMLEYDEVLEWAKLLEKRLEGFKFMDGDERSRIAVLQNMKRYVDRWIIKPRGPS